MAFLKMTAAAPTVLELSSDVDKRTEKLIGEAYPETEDIEKCDGYVYGTFQFVRIIAPCLTRNASQRS
ncbi:hypothetical protein K503DRAFT_799499 [Rhizopogon vinicolor AM-OR11-026]|uniref:Uncharacterized protein n=1 Tax=Rhizopogon vinicolor AM-OR11-026 TaxID=1314800 RepID=A0A1B7N463_9AGAM|nr:hypothetical protein K503DRAFT_799499 [Rhizopogon vinicolor AM-OR11-026]